VIKEFVERWEANKEKVREKFTKKHPDSYGDIIKLVVQNLGPPKGMFEFYPDPERIVEVDHGHYQGTLLYVIGGDGYQPSDYWFVKVSYGSCSGCDALEAIRGWGEESPTPQQVDDYMTLALHIVQGLKSMQEEGE
jgi:hypothetical protein